MYSDSVCFLRRTNTEVVAEEGGRTVFLTVSRSNGLESAVSVEWETQSDTASGSGKTINGSIQTLFSSFSLRFFFSSNNQYHNLFFFLFQRVLSL